MFEACGEIESFAQWQNRQAGRSVTGRILAEKAAAKTLDFAGNKCISNKGYLCVQ